MQLSAGTFAQHTQGVGADPQYCRNPEDGCRGRKRKYFARMSVQERTEKLRAPTVLVRLWGKGNGIRIFRTHIHIVYCESSLTLLTVLVNKVEFTC